MTSLPRLVRLARRARPRRPPTAATAGAVAHRVDAVEARRLQQAGAPLIDVRTPEEYRAGHAEGARSIPLARLSAAAAELLDGDVIVTICQSGARSGRAVALLHGRGLHVVDVEGGLDGWQARGLPHEAP